MAVVPTDGVPPYGSAAVRRAREALEAAVRGEPTAPLEGRRNDDDAIPELGESRGVFVTLNAQPGDRLRGCIGFPLPVFPLRTALVRAAASAALEDPRFRPVRRPELDHLTVEVSVLTVPEPIPGSPEQRHREVTVGRDGLIVEAGDDYGLLLPQVAPEQGWDSVRFLEGTCEKAGVPPDAWRRPGTNVHRFRAEIFRERSPNGPIDRGR
jgi:hypothetical protein